MAKKLQYKSDIEQGKIVESWHVSQSVDAFASTNQVAYDISVSGSFKVTGSQFIEPTNLNNQVRSFVLSYDNTTGQIFKMPTTAIGSTFPFVFNTTSLTGIQSAANTASGDNSIAMGINTTATGGGSTAMGTETTASGDASTAMGEGTKALGDSSLAIGDTTIAGGSNSTAMGINTIASGDTSTAMGSGTTASGIASTAMGVGTEASGSYSTAMGASTVAKGYASTSIGQYNVLNTGDNTTVYTASNTAFSIGNGTAEGSRSDAFKVLFNGTTTIGTSTPIAGAMLSVFRSIAPTAAVTTVGEFHDFTYTGVVTDQSIYAHIVRNQYMGSNPANLIVGANNIARKTTGSTGTAKDLIGTYSQANNLGSGNISGAGGIIAAYGIATFNSDLNSSVNQITGTWGNTQIIGTGTQTVSGGAIGGIGQVVIDNPNVTINETIGIYSEIKAIKGNLGDTNLLQLNMAGDYSTPDASLSINNFAYIRASDDFAMPNVTGTSHFINSSVPLPSIFSGSITCESIVKSGGTSTEYLMADGSVTTASYKVYTALLTQTGTAAPVATILENTTGGTITWSRTSSGTYVATISGAVLTVDKTIVFNNNGSGGSQFAPQLAQNLWIRTSDTQITIDVTGDNRLTNSSFEIRVYS